MTTTELLTSAVNARNLVAFEYDGKPRLVEPHAFGINAKGEQILRAFQIDGESATSPRSWKLFLVEKMVDLTITNVTFLQARPGYKTGDSAMKTILAELPALEAA